MQIYFKFFLFFGKNKSCFFIFFKCCICMEQVLCKIISNDNICYNKYNNDEKKYVYK